MQDYQHNLLLSPAVQTFIAENEGVDLRLFVLQNSEIGGVPSSIIADQIAGRKKSKEKIPEYYHASGIIYPMSINLEQASSSWTARFKTEVALESVSENGTVLDLTGGFGVDSYFLSRRFSHVIYVEPDAGLLSIAKHNHLVLGATNIEHHESTAEALINSTNLQFDAIFIDPSRRVNTQKVSGLKNSVPDIVAMQHSLYAKSDVLLIKASPLLDITAALKELDFICDVYVLSIDNDCKELLFSGRRGSRASPFIRTVNTSRNESQEFSFYLEEEKRAVPVISEPMLYLYESNVSILKAGAFKLIASRFKLAKLAANSHLYTSDEVHHDFPGRIFRIDTILPGALKTLQHEFPDRKANIIARNYPLSVAELKSRYKMIEGGERYLIATSSQKRRFLLAATRLK